MWSASMIWPSNSKLAVLCDGSCDDGAVRMKERTNVELVMMAVIVMGHPWRRSHEHGHGSFGRLRWVGCVVFGCVERDVFCR